MNINVYDTFFQLKTSPFYGRFNAFILQHPQGNFFQAPGFFRFSESIANYRPLMLLAVDDLGAIAGSLLGVIQTSGSGLKSWLSRRMIIWGGPVLGGPDQQLVAQQLLEELKKVIGRRVIYVEFRNIFDTSGLKRAFTKAGFSYHDHLNFLVKTDDERAVRKRMSNSRWRQINTSLKAGARVVEATTEAEVLAFYEILRDLYRQKVKKPLVGAAFFLEFLRSGIGKFFLIKKGDEVLGGIVCPVFGNKVIYEWYVCGKDGLEKGLHPSVLATWAPIEYGIKNGFHHFDFMGAGRPDEHYGVREFKARFGGEEVSFGRYQLVVDKALYKIGELGLKVSQKIS